MLICFWFDRLSFPLRRGILCIPPCWKRVMTVMPHANPMENGVEGWHIKYHAPYRKLHPPRTIVNCRRFSNRLNLIQMSVSHTKTQISPAPLPSNQRHCVANSVCPRRRPGATPCVPRQSWALRSRITNPMCVPIDILRSYSQEQEGWVGGASGRGCAARIWHTWGQGDFCLLVVRKYKIHCREDLYEWQYQRTGYK